MSTPKPTTQAERLTRIETILEGAFGENGTFMDMRADIKAIRTDLDADVAEMAALKAKGAGLLVGVSLAFTAFGAFLRPHFESLIKLFH